MSKESFRNSMLAAGFDGTGKISKAGLVKCLDELKNELANPSDITTAMTNAGFYSSAKISKSRLVAVFNTMKAGFDSYAPTALFATTIYGSLHSLDTKKISKQDLNKMLSVAADSVFIPHISFLFYPEGTTFPTTVSSNDEYPIQIQISNIVVDNGTMIGIEKIVYNGRELNLDNITDMQITSGTVEQFVLTSGYPGCVIGLYSYTSYQSSGYDELTAIIDGIRCMIRVKCTINV